MPLAASRHLLPRRPCAGAILAVLLAAAGGAHAQAKDHAVDEWPASPAPGLAPAPALAREDVAALGRQLQVGDIVFTRVGAYPFRKVADATGTWTNHVGIVLSTAGPEPVIGESRFPFSGTTPFARFVRRSAGGRVAVLRLQRPLTDAQRAGVAAAAAKRAHAFYDTGFELRSRRQFCSRYVREVLQEGTGIQVGRIETFAGLLRESPGTHLGFWRAWYFGRIPWQRETVTPASLLRSPNLATVFDGAAA
ncbi:MAG: YebB family permuted papain-like enzyme [Burkholderiaceae bacterium]